MRVRRFIVVFSLLSAVFCLAIPSSLQSAPPVKMPKVCIFDPPCFAPDGKFVALRISHEKKKWKAGIESAWESPNLVIINTQTGNEVPRPAGRTWDVLQNDGQWSEAGTHFVLQPIEPDRLPALQWAWNVRQNRWDRPRSVKLAAKVGGNGDWSAPINPAIVALWMGPQQRWHFKKPRLEQRKIQATKDRVGPIRRCIASPDGNFWACVLGGQNAGPGTCLSAPSKIAILSANKQDVTPLGDAAPLTTIVWNKTGNRVLYLGKQCATLYHIDTKTVELIGDAGPRIRGLCFHPVTGNIWGIRESKELVELVEGKWVTRYTTEE